MKNKKSLIRSQVVTDNELARAIGEQLLLTRTRRKLSQREITKRGGGTQPTLQKIELGELGLWSQVTAYAHAMNVTLVDILREILAGTPAPPLSAEAAEMQELFAALPPGARRAFLQMAQEWTRRTRNG
jgi:transcriptional regulator with XRE-family HTH domain